MNVRISFLFCLIFLSLRVSSLSYRHGTRESVPKQKLTVKNDFLYLETGHVTINPDFVSVIRPFDFTNIYSLQDHLLTLTTQHDSVCDRIEDHFAPRNQFIKASPHTTFRKEAHRICQRLHMHLPEVRNVTDAQNLAKALLRHNDKTCHAGPTYQPLVDELLHPDGTDAQTSATTICDQPSGTFDVRARYRGYYEKVHQHYTFLTHRYQVNQAHSIDLCAGVNQSYPVYCQIPPAYHKRINQQLLLCRRHTNDMERAHASLTSSQNVLTQSITAPFLPGRDRALPFQHSAPETYNSHDLYPHLNMTHPDTFFKRSKRGAFMFIVSVFSIVASVLSLLATQAIPIHANMTYEALSINTQDTNIKLDNLDRDIMININSLRSFTSHVQASMSFYDSYLRILMSLQDNMLSFQGIVQALSYGQVTSEIMSSRDIEFLARKLNIGGDSALSYKPQDLVVRPVVFDGHLAVQIDIPVITASKQATLFEVRPYPIFYSNTKYVADCPIRHLAIYEHSNHFQSLTDDEYRSCLNVNHPCLARTPRISSMFGNCASNQFFDIDDQYLRHVPASDNAPFLFTFHNETYFSVGSDTPLTFHCSQNVRPGPDHELLLRGRGSFSNPALCTFQAFHMQYAPPKNIYTERHPIHEQFVLPDIVPRPVNREFEQLSDDDAAIRLLNFSNHSLLSPTHKWLIGLSVCTLFLILHLLVTYFYPPYARLPRILLEYLRGYFSCFEPPPPLSSPSPPTSPGSTPRPRFPTLTSSPKPASYVSHYADDIAVMDTRCSDSIATISESIHGSPCERNVRPSVVLAQSHPNPPPSRSVSVASPLKPRPVFAQQNSVDQIYARPRLLHPRKKDVSGTGMHDITPQESIQVGFSKALYQTGPLEIQTTLDSA